MDTAQSIATNGESTEMDTSQDGRPKENTNIGGDQVVKQTDNAGTEHRKEPSFLSKISTRANSRGREEKINSDMPGSAKRGGSDGSNYPTTGTSLGSTPETNAKNDDLSDKSNIDGVAGPVRPATPIEKKLQNMSGHDRPFADYRTPYQQNRGRGYRHIQDNGGYRRDDNWRRCSSGYSVRRGSDPPA